MLHAIPSVSREFLSVQFALSILPLIMVFLQQGVEMEVLAPAEDETLLSRTASAEECRDWTPKTARSRSASPKKRARPVNETHDDNEGMNRG